MLTPGTRLGPYEIAGSLGTGGMGEVYRARDSKLNRDVALKVLPESLAGDLDRLARFRREAQVLAALNHPNIAHIHGFEDSGPTQALVMELVEGPTLADRIAQGPIAPDEAIPIARQIVDAVESAHEQGIIHRDLKPANIKVRPDGTVKVLDFGLAKALDPAASSSAGVVNSPTITAHATQMGMILGSAAYMAPEQAKGQSVDKRADIWAFGVVLYEMLTGRQPFAADTIAETLAHVMTRDVDLAALPATVEASLRKLIARCLARDVKHRLRDIGEARIALERAETVPVVIAPAPGSRVRPGIAGWLALGVVLVGSGAMGWWMAPRQRPSQAPTHLRAILDPRPAIGFERASLRSFAFTGDGRAIVFVATDGTTRRLYRRELDQAEAIAIAGTDGAAGPFISADSAWVGFSADGALKKVPVAGGGVVTLHALRSTASADTIAMGWANDQGPVSEAVFGAAWLPDDTIVYGRFAGGLWQISAEGGTPRALTKVREEQGELAHRLPHALPGGKALLFTVQTSLLGDTMAVDALVMKTGERRRLVDEGSDGRYSGDGRLLFARQGSLFAVRFDPETLAVSGEPARVLSDIMHGVRGTSPGSASGAAQYDVSVDGTLGFLQGGILEDSGKRLAWTGRGGRLEPLEVEALSYLAPRISPDGRTISVSGKRQADSARTLYLIDRQRAVATPLMKGAIFAVWMPDGQRLVAAWRRGGVEGQSIYTVPVAGGAPELLVASKYPLWPSSVSADGHWLAYVESNPTTGNDIWIAGLNPVVAPRAILKTAANEEYPTFSPDGRLFAYASSESGAPDIYVQGFPEPGRREQVSKGGGHSPSWSRDGRALFYQTADGRRIMQVAIQPGDPVQVGPSSVFAEGAFDGPTPVGGNDQAADGRLLVTVRSEPKRPARPLEQLQLLLNATSGRRR